MTQYASKLKFYSVLGILNVLVGAGFFVLYAPRPVEAQPIASQPVLPAKPAEPKYREARQGVPTRIVIPSLGIDLPVAVGSYNPADSSWTLDEVQAFYADISVPANDNNGTTLIYGHAQSAVFSRLLDVTGGAEAVVYTNTGNVFKYVYQTRQEVDPSDLSLLRVDGPPALILQTCSGPWDAYRTMISFQLISVERA